MKILGLLLIIVVFLSGCGSLLPESTKTQLEAARVDIGSDNFSNHYKNSFEQYKKIYAVVDGNPAPANTVGVGRTIWPSTFARE